MGAYLSKPVTEKVTETGENVAFKYGVSTMQGWRTSMEDAHVIKLDLGDEPGSAFFGVYDGHGGAEVARYCSLHMPDEFIKCQHFKEGQIREALKRTYLGVDELLRDRSCIAELKTLREMKENSGADLGVSGLPLSIQQAIQGAHRMQQNEENCEEGRDPDSDDPQGSNDNDDDESVHTLVLPGGGRISIVRENSGKRQRVSQKPDLAVDLPSPEEQQDDDFPDSSDTEGYSGPSAGCTAVVAVVIRNKLYVANAGDSRCVLCRGKETISLTHDHKPTDPEEESRIRAAGGYIAEGRINGSLNLSRAIGDFDYKQTKEKPAEEQIVTANPEIREIELTKDDRFLILACDGIWDILTNEEAVAFVDEKLAEGHSPKAICEMVCDRCLATTTDGMGKGCDNMSVLIVLLKTPGE